MKVKILSGLFVFTLYSFSISAQSLEEFIPGDSNKIETQLVNREYTSTQEDLKSWLTSGSANVEGFASLLDSFISDVEISSLFGGLDGDKNTPITFDYNFNLFGDSLDNDAQFQLTLNTNSKISEDLAGALGLDLTSQLEKKLNDLDNIKLSFSYSFINEKYGVGIGQHQSLFREAMSSAIQREDFSKLKLDLMATQNQLYEMDGMDQLLVSQAVTANKIDCEFVRIYLLKRYLDNKSAASAQEESNQANALCKKRQSLTERLNGTSIKLTSEYRPYLFASLIANQPQFQISGSIVSKDDLVGPDEFSIKLSYSFGADNLNKVRRLAEANSISFSESYLAFVNDPKYFNVKDDGKFSLSLEYINIDDHKFSLQDVDFLKLGGERFEGSLGYSKTLIWEDHKPNLKMDLSASFEEFLGDNEGKDRFVATATFTKKINSKLSIPISIQYANRSEFLSNDNDEFTGNIGFKYDFDFAH